MLLISLALALGFLQAAEEGIGGAFLTPPPGWEASRPAGSSELLIMKSPQQDPEQAVVIAVTTATARYSIGVARATGSELGARMMQNRKNGWELRSRGTYRTAQGLPFGRFDYQTITPLRRQAYILVQCDDRGARFLEIQAFSRRPFNDWREIDVLLSDLIDSVRVSS